LFQIINLKKDLIVAFIILLICTIYYTRSKSFEERNVGLVIFSFVQGLLLSVIFPIYLLHAPILALAYYLFFSYFWAITFMFKSQKLEEYDEDEKLVQTLREIPGIKKFEFKFRKYSGTNSLNANVIPLFPFISNKYQISFGDELISKFTVEEKMVVLAHEIGHVLKKHMLLQSFLFFLVLIGLFFLSLRLNLLVLTYARSSFVLFDYIITFILFIIGIIGLNLISWYAEYDADKKAIQLTKDIKNFESTFLKLGEGCPNKDYGIVINLIVHSHPLLNNRIKKGKEVYRSL
jgi:Zn-dependent protease with chaperone function